ncbi:hypothetical protein V1389_17060 [Flavobacterium rakeshii]|uniref:DUF7674 family protein n=1 Tax=Flavobacterium rakeshii TaxID=1038845 RepID=UPI002E7AB1B8|nr:hypothetical protein [Flavobacterium rakeshii]MEE1900061.1 hypothetical protein [Flavobacterium rakeshii]
METKIKKTIYEWLPEAIVKLDRTITTDYEIIRSVSEYSLSLLQKDNRPKVIDVFKIINMLYQEEHAYTKHCIENEFICNFIENSPALKLKEYLYDMPSPLKEAFIKTLIEL